MCKRMKPLKKCRVTGSWAIMLDFDVGFRHNRAAIGAVASATPFGGRPALPKLSRNSLMARVWQTVSALSVGLCLGILFCHVPDVPRTHASEARGEDPETRRLKAEIQEIKD